MPCIYDYHFNMHTVDKSKVFKLSTGESLHSSVHGSGELIWFSSLQIYLTTECCSDNRLQCEAAVHTMIQQYNNNIIPYTLLLLQTPLKITTDRKEAKIHQQVKGRPN